MKTFALTIAAALVWGIGSANAGDWKPAKGPLMTKWAKDVNSDKPHPEYPRPQMIRKDWLNLNGIWQLAFAKKGEEAPVGKDLPEKILVPFPVESALSGVMKRAERLWYRRTFTLPPEWSDKRLLLHFGAVDWEATVWLNGKKLGTHQGGYDGFTFDVTDALSKKGDQELIVGVWDPTDAGTQPRGKQVNNPEGIYYTPTTGIWQTVWVEPVPKAYIESVKITPNVDKGSVRFDIKLAGDVNDASVYATILVGEKEIISGMRSGPRDITLDLRFPKLWSPESPFLYNLKIGMFQRGEVKAKEEVSSYFAMRKIEVGKDKQGVTRILLNGKPYFQVGPLDQGFWPDGLYTAPTDEALKYDIEITKKLGFNMTRKHVKVEPDRWYYWCDKLGLLVWQDMPSGDKGIGGNDPDLKRSPESAKQYEKELKALIDGRSNHPSIILWVVFNEGWGQFDTERITKWTKEYDPTRLVDCASGWTDRKVGDVHDMHKYPDPGSPDPEPKRAAVLGEFGGIGLPTKGHMWTEKDWGYIKVKDKADLTRRYERMLQTAYKLRDKPGLSAAVYTQITDVETEANGLLSYDRAVIKVDLARAAAANKGDFSKVSVVKVVVPTSQEKGINWRFTLDKPADGWFKSDFDDTKWQEGPGGFGTKGTPGAVIGTEWKTDDIWIRREFDLPKGSFKNLRLLLHHDEDVEVYLNGVLAFKAPGYITEYEEFPITEEALAALMAGKNHIAVHCHQTTGGQYIDVGMIEVK